MKVKEKVQACKLLQAVPSFLGTMAAAAFSPLFLFFKNAGEAHFRDVAPTMLMFMAAGAVLYALTLLLTRNPSRAGIISVAFLVVFLNYANIEAAIQALLPSLRYWHIMPLLLVVLLHLGWLVWKKLPLELATIIMPVMAVVFGVLILINGVMSIPAMTTRIRTEREAKRLAEETVVADSTMPNFYFLLFDEFSSIPFMEKHYNYDNSGLVEELESMGFSVSQSGHNYTASTSVVTTNIMNLDYVVRYEQSEEEKIARRVNNFVFPMLKDAGYSFVGLSGSTGYGIENAVTSEAGNAVTVGGETAHTLLMNMTVLYPRAVQYYPEVAQQMLDELAYLKEPSHFEESNQFVLFHITCPHAPFFFNADGTLSENVSSKWTDPSGYLNQYKFASSQMVEIADSIISNDPNAIVWLLSDHSGRASTDPEHEGFPNEDMTNFFNAVYYQGEKLDIEGLSGVNTFRLILNELLGTEFEMIPMPAE